VTPGRALRTARAFGARRTLLRLLRRPRHALRGLVAALGGGATADELATLNLPFMPPPGAPFVPPSRLTFVGIAREVGDPPDWSTAPSRLWSYHLHYLDALRDEAMPPDQRTRWLTDWTRSNPPGGRPGWEPFPISLRLVNALEVLSAKTAPVAPEVVRSLARQAWWLEGTLEHELGANHLLKNAFALAWAGRVLRSRRAATWRSKGDRLLRRELSSQLLADGFHEERCPGYHAVLVEDLLRFHALLSATGESESALGRQVAFDLARAAGALASVLHQDGDIPLFNDAAIGQALPGAELVRRAEAVLGPAAVRRDAAGAVAAGFHRLEGGGATVIVDLGEAGSPANPGHVHADSLSFELSAWGRRVIVDAGTFDYEPSEERRFARSTAAHNTVEIDGQDSSEVWGVFRVGRMARPRDVRRAVEGGAVSVSAAHDGYRHLPGAPVHRRTLGWSGGAWCVEDVVDGAGSHRAVGRLRLHHDLDVSLDGSGGIVASCAEGEARIRPEAGTTLGVEEGVWFPSFGIKRACRVATMRADGTLPLRFGFRIELTRRG
jgi:uncharacterized heparinase superfamily protein